MALSLKFYFPDQDETKLTETSTVQALYFPDGKYTIQSVLGKGQYGVVYKVTDSQGQEYACKIGKNRTEFETQLLYNQVNLSPTVYEIIDIVQYPGVCLCIMDIVQGSLKDMMDKQLVSEGALYNALKCLIKKKYLFGYPDPFIHGDFHVDNIVLLKDNSLGIIDFAFARTAPPVYQLLDVFSLVGSINEYVNRRKSVQYSSLSVNMLKFFNYLFSLTKTPSSLQKKYFMRKNKIFFVYYKDGVEVSFDYQVRKFPPSINITDDTVKKILQVFPDIQLPTVVQDS